jgi:serine/threonine protein kinase
MPTYHFFIRVVALEDVDQITGVDGSPLTIADFDLLCVLGQGCWGKVVAARHKHTNITFALKIMHKQRLFDQNAYSTIIRERKIMSELLHPFILNLHGYFSTSTKLYMVLRLAPGGDMSHMIARQSRNNFCFPTSVARFVIAQIILAIEYMHGRGILHRDIKTENILIDQNGYCLLADMGLSCFCEEVAVDSASTSDQVLTSATAVESPSTSFWAEPSIKKHENHLINQRHGSAVRATRSSLLGTPEYLAPEMLNFKRRPNYGSSADWWAVGILLYELLHGACSSVSNYSKDFKIFNGLFFVQATLRFKLRLPKPFTAAFYVKIL